jgi:hypothetical protein
MHDVEGGDASAGSETCEVRGDGSTNGWFDQRREVEALH